MNNLRILRQQDQKRANSLDSGSRSVSPPLFVDYSPCHSQYHQREQLDFEAQEILALQQQHQAHAEFQTAYHPHQYYPTQFSPVSKPFSAQSYTDETYEEDSTTVTSGQEFHPYFQSHARLSRVMRALPTPPSWQRNFRGPEYLDDQGWLLKPSYPQYLTNTFYDDNWYLEPFTRGHEWVEESKCSTGARRYSGEWGSNNRSTSQPPNKEKEFQLSVPKLKTEAKPFYPTSQPKRSNEHSEIVNVLEFSPPPTVAQTAQPPPPLKLPESIYQQNYFPKHYSRWDKKKSRNLLSSSLSAIVVEEAEDEEPKGQTPEEESKFITRRSSTGFGFVNNNILSHKSGKGMKHEHQTRGKRGAKRKTKQSAQQQPAQNQPAQQTQRGSRQKNKKKDRQPPAPPPRH